MDHFPSGASTEALRVSAEEGGAPPASEVRDTIATLTTLVERMEEVERSDASRRRR